MYNQVLVNALLGLLTLVNFEARAATPTPKSCTAAVTMCKRLLAKVHGTAAMRTDAVCREVELAMSDLNGARAKAQQLRRYGTDKKIANQFESQAAMAASMRCSAYLGVLKDVGDNKTPTQPVERDEGNGSARDANAPAWLGVDYCVRLLGICDKNTQSAPGADGIERVVRNELSLACSRTRERMEGLTRQGASPGILKNNLDRACGSFLAVLTDLQDKIPERISPIPAPSPEAPLGEDGGVDGTALARQLSERTAALQAAQMELAMAIGPFLSGRAAMVELSGPFERVNAAQQPELTANASISIPAQRFTAMAGALGDVLRKHSVRVEALRCPLEPPVDGPMPPAVFKHEAAYSLAERCANATNLQPDAEHISLWLQTDYDGNSVAGNIYVVPRSKFGSFLLGQMTDAARRTRLRFNVMRGAEILVASCRSFIPYAHDTACDYSGYSSGLGIPGLVTLATGSADHDYRAPHGAFVISRMIRSDLSASSGTWHKSVTIQFKIPNGRDFTGARLEASLEQVPIECQNASCDDLGRPSDAEVFKLDVDWDAQRRGLQDKVAAMDNLRGKLLPHLLALADGQAVGITNDPPRIDPQSEDPQLIVPIRVQVDAIRHKAIMQSLQDVLNEASTPKVRFQCSTRPEEQPYSNAFQRRLAPYGSIIGDCYSEAYAALKSAAGDSFYLLMFAESEGPRDGIVGTAYGVPVAAIAPETHLKLSGGTALASVRLELLASDGTVIAKVCTTFSESPPPPRGPAGRDNSLACHDTPVYVEVNALGILSATGSHASRADHYLFVPLVFDNMSSGGEPLARFQRGFEFDVMIPVNNSWLSSLKRVSVTAKFGKQQRGD